MLILPEAAQIIFAAISPGSSLQGSKLDTAYLEFAVGSGSVIPTPEINPANSLAYYAGLAAFPDRDYLRCPILSHILGTTSSGRPKLTVLIVSDGEVGIHGKPFSAGSRVYGLAVAAARSNKEQEDIIFGRHYYATTELIEKPSQGGVMLSFDLSLT